MSVGNRPSQTPGVLPASRASPAFHGMTIISGHGALTRPIPGGHITKAPYPNPYRCAWGPCDMDECSLRCLDYLKNDLLVNVSPSDETAAIVADLQIPFDHITVVHGDTETIPFGGGTHGSRGAVVGGHAALVAAERVVGKAREVAAEDIV